MPLTERAAVLSERNCLISGDFIRRRALARLYERKAAVDALIRSLEVYERAKQRNSGECVPFMAPLKCS